MASDFATPGTRTRLSPGMILARQDRITVWPLPGVYLFVLGMGFIFTFYDIFDINLIGGILIAMSAPARPHEIPWGHFIGSLILFFGFNVWVPMTYAWSAENFPTRARVTGFGIVDGVGHIGGGLGLLAIAPILPQIGVLPSFLLIAGFLIVAAIIAQFGVNTRGKALEDVSP